jgi:hypothetical protein
MQSLNAQTTREIGPPSHQLHEVLDAKNYNLEEASPYSPGQSDVAHINNYY